MIDANNVYNETRIHFQGLTVVIMTLLIATEYLWQSVDILRFSWSHSRFSSLVHDLSPNMTYPRIVSCVTRRLSLVERQQFTLTKHLFSVLSGDLRLKLVLNCGAVLTVCYSCCSFYRTMNSNVDNI